MLWKLGQSVRLVVLLLLVADKLNVLWKALVRRPARWFEAIAFLS